MADQAQIEHLLRRTEYVARPARVAELTPMSIEAAVDNILTVPASPGSVSFTTGADWQRGMELTDFWLNRMAHDSPRPIQEKMAFFWHGHFCSEITKVGTAAPMRDQIDLFRTAGLGNLRSLAVSMSTQVAMLRYLDNNQNKKTSPNQNFARELMELFLLGVGNYTEADVEAGTAAWTGHTDQWDNDAYVWRDDWHDAAPKQFLGRTINTGADHTRHGYDTIEVILGDGVVPAGAANVANRGRPTKQVAAEFISKKLWAEFAGTPIPPAALSTLRDVAIANDFAITPWLRALLTRSEFYAADVMAGRVRSPVEFVVATMHAMGRRAETGAIWLMHGMGQAPLFPPDVSGWKHNDYWISASAMSKRADTARHFMWRSMDGFWSGDGLIHLGGGTISRHEMEVVYKDQPAAVVDRMLQLMNVSLAPSSRQALVDYSTWANWWDRTVLVSLILMAPDFHVG